MTSQLLELADGVVEEVLCDDGLHHDLQPGLRILVFSSNQDPDLGVISEGSDSHIV